MTSVPGFDHYLEARRAEIDVALEAALPGPPGCPRLIVEAMRYSLFAGGKRLRPILTLAAAEAVVDSEHTETRSRETGRAQALPAACAVELVHTYSLVHDDLPAMDDDDLRRGQPTAHVVYGDGVAILAGDAMLTHAFVVLTRRWPNEPPGCDRRRLHAIACLAQAAGAAGMVGGQVLDLTATGTGTSGVDPHQNASGDAALREMHARKTGALISAAAVTGAILAGGDDTAVAAVDRYATSLGLAFQIVDDILDVEGTTANLGKNAGKDADARKLTYPAVHGLDRSRVLAADAAAAARETLATAGLAGRLAEIADWVVSRSH